MHLCMSCHASVSDVFVSVRVSLYLENLRELWVLGWAGLDWVELGN